MNKSLEHNVNLEMQVTESQVKCHFASTRRTQNEHFFKSINQRKGDDRQKIQDGDFLEWDERAVLNV